MAEHSPQQGWIKKLQEETKCFLCLADLDDPKRLPCGHIYCKLPCLQGLLLQSMDSTVTCPKCQSIAQVPSNDLDNIPSASHINRLQQVYSELCKVYHNPTMHDSVVPFKDVLALEEVREKILSQKEDLTHEITASWDTLFCVLEEQKQALLIDLQEQIELKLASIEAQQQEIEAASSKFQQIADSVYKTVTHDDDGYELLSKKPQLEAKLTELTITFSRVSLSPAVELDLIARVLPPAELEEACVSTNYVRKGVPYPQRCSAEGDGLIRAEIHTTTMFTIHVANEHGVPCSGKVSVELKTLRDGTITQPQVTACSPSQYKVSYIPTVRGRHELSIKVNGEHITDSPFKVFVWKPVKEIKDPVAEMTDLVHPIGLHCAAESILVCDYMIDQVAVYNYSNLRRDRSQLFTMKLKKPAQVTTDGQFNIYVTTAEDHSLHKFTKDGTHIKTVTSAGYYGGQFNCPNGMCIYEDKLLYICDSENRRVLVFNLELTYLSQVRGKFVWPSGVAVDTSGNLYISDYVKACIKVLTPSGRRLHTIRDQLSGPVNVKILAEVLYVSDYYKNCVSAFTLSGEYIGSFGHEHLESPEGLAIDEDGYMYTTSKRKSIFMF